MNDVKGTTLSHLRMVRPMTTHEGSISALKNPLLEPTRNVAHENVPISALEAALNDEQPKHPLKW